MERLTDTYWRNFDPWECCGQDYYCKRGCHDEGGCTKGCIVPKLYRRLGCYEDTGLEPGEVMALLDPPNDPLTLEDLLEMDGEPVWVVGVSSINDFKGHWDICDWENNFDGKVIFPYCGEVVDPALYGKTWMAYRRKPEEVDT